MFDIRGHLLPVLCLATLAACSAPASSPDPTADGSHPPTRPPLTTPIASMSPDPGDGPPASDRAPATSRPTSEPTPSAAPTAGGVMFDQPWAVAEITDVATGEQFRIADLALAGKVVFVEPMAIWCSSCRAQQEAAVAAFQELDEATVEWVAIDVETTETAEALARYREQNDFPFRYVIADTSLSRSLAEQFGDVVLSPPSVNVIVVAPDGRTTHLLGHNSAADLVAIAADHGA